MKTIAYLCSLQERGDFGDLSSQDVSFSEIASFEKNKFCMTILPRLFICSYL